MEDIILQDYTNYLIERGYKDFTPKGKPSTAYNYQSRIKTICKRENIDVHKLSKQIEFYVTDYDEGGNNFEFGKKSNSAYICALKRFEEFLM